MQQHPNTRGVSIDATGKKVFVPLENNPVVFTDLIHRLGVASDLGFYDVYNIYDRELLSFIPRPAHALIFISPSRVWETVREKDEGTTELTYDGLGDHEPVVWFKQTIGHACGLIALLHSVGNGTARQFIQPDSLVDHLLKETLSLKPLPRAHVLYSSEELEKAHMASASMGDTVPPSSEEPNGYHFISFVKGNNGHLFELEGCWNGPIDRGALDESEDVLSEHALSLGVGRFVDAAKDNIEFSLVALATKPL